MFDQLRQAFSTSSEPRWAQGELASWQRIYAVGDIHGRADLLKQLLKKIIADAETYRGDITLVILGDVIDHGVQSAEVVEILARQIPSRWNSVFLKGNHEWMMLNFIKSPAEWSQWLGWGGEATLASYSVRVRDAAHRLRPLEALAAELDEAIQSHGHQAFYMSQINYWRHQGYAFVHAGVRHGLTWEEQLESDLLMQHYADFNGHHDLPERIVFGHTIYKQPIVNDMFIGIDTGARSSGILTAAVLEEKSLRFLQTLV